MFKLCIECVRKEDPVFGSHYGPRILLAGCPPVWVEVGTDLVDMSHTRVNFLERPHHEHTKAEHPFRYSKIFHTR